MKIRGFLPLACIILLFAMANIVHPSLSHAVPGSRVLHFSPDRSIGAVLILDASKKRQIETYYHWIDGNSIIDCDYLSEAQGDVIVPPGKKVFLRISVTGRKDLSPLARLAPDDVYNLTIAEANPGDRVLEDAQVACIARLKGLKILDIRHAKLTNTGMGLLTNMKSLEMLSLPQYVTDQDFAWVGRMTWLKRLYMAQSRMTNAGLAPLENLTSLTELELAGGYFDESEAKHITGLGDASLVHLAKLPSLQYLMFSIGAFSDAGLVHLRTVPSLRNLNLGNQPITDKGLAEISHLTWLESLGLRHTQITGAGLPYLKSLTVLKNLDFSAEGQTSTSVSDTDMAAVKEIKSLECLKMSNFYLTDKGVAYISDLTNLKVLHLPGICSWLPDVKTYTDEGLKLLTKMQKLEDLALGSCGITDAGVASVAKLPNLRKLWITSFYLTNQSANYLSTIKPLESLDIGQSKMTISGISQLNTLSNLKMLWVSSVEQDNSVLNLSGLTKLENFSISVFSPKKNPDGSQAFRITDEDLKCFAKMKSLKWFQVGHKNPAITDKGMSYLAGMTSMQRITIGGPNVTNEGLSHLAGMRGLQDLYIDGNFSDDGLRRLESIKSLGYVSISSPGMFSLEAVDNLKKNLPNLTHLEAMQ